MLKRRKIKDFDYYIDEYMYYCRSRRLREKTMQSYEQTLRLFERWCLENENIKIPSEVRDMTIRHYISDLQERGKYTFYSMDENKKYNCPERRRDFRENISPVTINNYLRNLRAFFNWFTDETGGCNPNPMDRIKMLKVEREAKEYLSNEEVQKLLKIFDLSYFSEHRDHTIIILLLDTGMRIGECLKIQMSDIDLAEKTIFLPARNTKGGKDRHVFFSAKTARILQRWIRFKDRYSESNLLFHVKYGTPLEVGTFESNMRKYLIRAGIEKEFSPHALRNNFAKRCIMAGMDLYSLSRILGHSSVTVTERAYLDLTDEDLKHRYRGFSPIENM